MPFLFFFSSLTYLFFCGAVGMIKSQTSPLSSLSLLPIMFHRQTRPSMWAELHRATSGMEDRLDLFFCHFPPPHIY